MQIITSQVFCVKITGDSLQTPAQLCWCACKEWPIIRSLPNSRERRFVVRSFTCLCHLSVKALTCFDLLYFMHLSHLFAWACHCRYNDSMCTPMQSITGQWTCLLPMHETILKCRTMLLVMAKTSSGKPQGRMQQTLLEDVTRLQ
jgi:hypothetical protein